MAERTNVKSTVKTRQTSNAYQISPLPMNEKILKECHNLYTDKNQGLITIAKAFDEHLLPPRKKITILLIGNHSAGKSSFINWYAEEHIQKTGVAIETQGFCLVTSGKKRESLMGNATLYLYPHFKPLQSISGVLDFLTTEISTSKQKKFGLVTFIDTPGLVDGDMKYPFDVNEALYWLGGVADLIFVFFDPMGQALCKRTLDILEKLNNDYASKVRLYLAKIDEAGTESDRQKVMMQIVQELCKRPGLNRNAFDMPCIFIPSADLKSTTCGNQIEEVCEEINRTINRTIQTTLNTLEKDAENVQKRLDEQLKLDDEHIQQNNETKTKAMIAGVIPLAILANFLIHLIGRTTVTETIGGLASLLFTVLAPIEKFFPVIPDQNRWKSVFFAIFFSCLVYVYLLRYLKPEMTTKKKRTYLAFQNHVVNGIKLKKQEMYTEYLEQCVGDHDLGN